ILPSFFEEVHTIKSIASYLNNTGVYKTMLSLEQVLAILKHKKPPLRTEIIDWFLMFSDHIAMWYEGLQATPNEFEFESIDALTINMLSGCVTLSRKGSDILKDLNLMMLGTAPFEVNLLDEDIRNSCKVFITEKKIKLGFAKLINEKVDILLLPGSIGFDHLYIVMKKVKEHLPGLPVIIYDDVKIKKAHKQILKKFGVEQYIEGEITKDTVLSKLILVGTAYYQESGIKFLDSSMLKSIENLKPLPQSLIDINLYRKDPNAPVAGLTSIIMRDPQLSAKVLKFVNSAAFNLASNIASIQHAITLLGKEQVIALALQTVVEDTFDIDLSAYGIDVDRFYEISQQRMLLIMNWYKKISYDDLALLTTAALLGSIGQIIISEDIIKHNNVEGFKALMLETEPAAAEVEFNNTTAEDITADIMTHWGLDDSLVQLVRYSRDLANAPDDLKSLSLAMHIVFRTCLSDGRPLENDLKEHLVELLTELNFEPKYYLDAVEKLGL
ncbi:MAG TPA: HDOD domain-containing protein, partial [Sulfurimonas sp.]|nr:HDOD domain-containing protein [Sulfurimonas sp.]